MAFCMMAAPRKGIIHQYTARLSAFEQTPQPTSASAHNLIIFIGGLFDGLGTVPYSSSISDALPPTWSLAQVIISSSYKGWGTSSLQKDVNELSKCVSYFQALKKGRIILMGHSTGCQDVMEYLTGPGHETRAPIDGGVIQAPVSDREAILMAMAPEVYESICNTAQSMVNSGQGKEILSSTKDLKKIFPCPISASRWLSLASPGHDGEDDYFSSDLTTEQLMKSFGSLPPTSPLCILISGEDEYMPKSVDKEALLKRWIDMIKKGQGKVDERASGILKGASHNLAENEQDIIDDLVRRVREFTDFLAAHSNL